MDGSDKMHLFKNSLNFLNFVLMIDHPKMNMLSSFPLGYFISNLYDFLSPVDVTFFKIFFLFSTNEKSHTGLEPHEDMI